jgi:pullulanase/glycogen debranching enzyme
MDRLAQAGSPDGRTMTEFVARVIALRKNYPLLREMRFLFGDREVLPGLYDVSWFDESGAALTIDAWQDPEGRALTLRRAGPGLNGETEVILIMMNGSSQALNFAAPAPHLEWNVLMDSAVPDALPPADRRGTGSAAHSVPRHCWRSRPGTPTGRPSGWPAPHEGPRLLTALPPDPGTHRTATDSGTLEGVMPRTRRPQRRKIERRRRQNGTKVMQKRRAGSKPSKSSALKAHTSCPKPQSIRTSVIAYCLPFGAHLTDAGRTRYRFWAPSCKAVQLELYRTESAAPTHRHDPHRRRLVRSAWPMAARARVPVSDQCGSGGARSGLPLPARRRARPERSDRSACLSWENTHWHGRPWEETVLYEVHVGALGGYAGVTRRLKEFATSA